MTDLREMLGTITLEPAFNVEGLATLLQALSDLDRDSTACAMAMAAEDDAADMIPATRAALDCADIATAAQRVLSRGVATSIGVTRAVLEAAVAAADRCAAECAQHAAHHAHCRVHAESARQAAAHCRTELGNLPS